MERLMADALKEGLTPVQVFETVFGKAVNRALANGMHPSMVVFELKTCEHQLVSLAVNQARQAQPILHQVKALDPRLTPHR